MNAYAPASSLGWLDLDAAASERVGTMLRSLEEPTTIDVLGLGAVRDAFSAMLSPGTSTIETRLRYLIFLPWIFKRLEDQRVPAADFARRLRDAEAQLVDCLRHLGPGRGVIGFRAGRNLRRMPSELYWGSMYGWGIRQLDLSIAQYGQRSAMPGVTLDVDYPWLVPARGLPDRLVEVLRHARCFSEVTLGPQLVYNLLLAREARDELGWDTKELEDRQRDRIKSWVELVKDRHVELCSWAANLPEF